MKNTAPLTQAEIDGAIEAYHKKRLAPKAPRHERPRRRRMLHPDALKEMGVIVHPNYVLAYHGMSPFGISRAHRRTAFAVAREQLKREERGPKPPSPSEELAAARKDARRNTGRRRYKQAQKARSLGLTKSYERKMARKDVQRYVEEYVA